MATFDYGTDISCLKDFSPDGRTVTGRLVVAEAIFRRLYTPRGRLIDDPNYGLDVPAYINEDMSQSDVAALQQAIAQECIKDERVVSADVLGTLGANGVLTITIDLHLADGPYRLVLAASAVTFSILNVTP